MCNSKNWCTRTRAHWVSFFSVQDNFVAQWGSKEFTRARKHGFTKKYKIQLCVKKKIEENAS